MSKQTEKKILQESEDEGMAGVHSRSFRSMPDLSNLNQESESPVNTGQLAESVIVRGSRSDADDFFRNPLFSSEEEEEESGKEESKSVKRKGLSSRGAKERKQKVARTEDLSEGEEEMEERASDPVGNVGVVEKAPFALTTRIVSQYMFMNEKPDKRLDHPIWALDCIALWIQEYGQDTSKWHLLQDKAARRKAFKWTKVIDLYFENDRQGEVAKEWFKKHFEGQRDLTGNVYKLSTEVGHMDEVIGRVFCKTVHRPYAYAFLIKLAEAMGQKHVDALHHSIWLEAEEVMRNNWGIWCQRISMREKFRGGYTYALSGVKTRDIGDEYRIRYDGLGTFDAYVTKAKQLAGSSDGKPFQRANQKKRGNTVEAASSRVELVRPPAFQVKPVTVELGAVPAPTTTSTGEVMYRVLGWTPYVPNEDDDLKWRKEAGELSPSELDAALATLEAQSATGAKDRKEIQKMLCEKIDDVTSLDAKFQVLRKVQETSQANKRVCKRVGQIFGEKNAADAVNALIKSFLDFYEGKVPDLREAAASVAEEYRPEISQRLKSGSDLLLVPMDITCPPSPVASSSSASGSGVPVLTQRPVGTHSLLKFTPGSTSTPTKVCTLLGDSQQSSSQGSGSAKPFTLPAARIPQLPEKITSKFLGKLVRSNVRGPFKAPRVTREAIERANEKCGPRPPTPPMSEERRLSLERGARASQEWTKREAVKSRLKAENSWQLKKWREAQEAMKGMSTVERELYYKRYLAEVDQKRREWVAEQRAAKRAEKEKKKKQAQEKLGITPDAKKDGVATEPEEGELQSDKEEDDADGSDGDIEEEEEEFDVGGIEEEEEYEGEDNENGVGVSGPETALQVLGSDVAGDNETGGAQTDRSEVDKTGDQQSGKKEPEVQDPEVKVPDGNEDKGNEGDTQDDARTMAEKKDADVEMDISGDGN